ncbi:MAG TPA: xanthine dehydrogenase family protein subunit M [Anaerolineae bacterium]|nr:xanthine dehydrogenase family protein subunit M [Anaerolineae bacterium]
MLPTNTHILFHEFEYVEPLRLDHVTTLLAQYGENARIIAGGTDLLVQMKMERRQPSHLISLARINALHEIQNGNSLTIGAATSIHALHQFLATSSRRTHSQFSALAEACNAFSTVQIMYMATLGGNLCNASPAADTAPCLLVFDANVTLQSNSGERVIPLTEFFVGPGKTVLHSDELLTHVHLPAPAPHTGSAFLKISRVIADISQVCAAARITRDGNLVQDARIALGSVAPTPIRAPRAESALIGQPFSSELAEQVGEIAADEIKPISDVRATRDYRQRVARVIVRDALVRAWERTT